MTDAAWRHIDTVTKEMYQEGAWYWMQKFSGGSSATPSAIKFPSFKQFCKSDQVYGPIPGPPKLPPKLRRFTATYKGMLVSGVYHENSFRGMAQVFAFDEGNSKFYANVFITSLTDLVWLDPEE